VDLLHHLGELLRLLGRGVSAVEIPGEKKEGRHSQESGTVKVVSFSVLISSSFEASSDMVGQVWTFRRKVTRQQEENVQENNCHCENLRAARAGLLLAFWSTPVPTSVELDVSEATQSEETRFRDWSKDVLEGVRAVCGQLLRLWSKYVCLICFISNCSK
jgi:hypothetical protein